MSLEVSGRIEKILEVQSGESARGPWKKQSFVIETKEQYPKKVCIVCWGDKVEDLNRYPEGSDVKVSINLESREYNERWYTDIKAWRIEAYTGESTPAQNANPPVANTQENNPATTTQTGDTSKSSESFVFENDEDDALPF